MLRPDLSRLQMTRRKGKEGPDDRRETPTPGLQRELWVEGAQYFVDFDFAGEVVGEFDGQRKYMKDRRPGDDASQAVIRENAIRSTGAEVVRWDGNDLGAGRMIPRLGRALRSRRLI